MIRDIDGSLQRQVGVLFEAGTLVGWGDGALLDRFASGRDHASEAAFACLVERHGPMVLRVCRATLGDEHEAHDAFQATFLVLARKARSVRVRDTIGPWLHGVAWRVASRARAAVARRRRHERRAAEMAARSFEESIRDDSEAALHEEVRRLPDGYREAVVLCDLEGLTTDGAAERLGLPVGTVRSRLYRGRDRLRGRLLRRGIAPAAVAAGSASAVAVPSALAEATVRLAVGLFRAGAVPARLAVLMHGGRHVMGMKSLAAIGVSFGLVAGVGGLSAQGPGDGPKGAKPPAEARPTEARSTQQQTWWRFPTWAKPSAEARFAAWDNPAATPVAPPRSDRDRLQGHWKVVRARIEGGNDYPRDHPVFRSPLTFRGDEVAFEGARGAMAEWGTFRVIDDVRPRGFLTTYPGPPAHTTWTAFEFAGDDRLKLRSTTFDGAPGADHPGILLTELVREGEAPVSTLARDAVGAPGKPDPKPAAPKADVATDRERLQGRWTIVSAKLNGHEPEANDALLNTVTFRGNEIQFARRSGEDGPRLSFLIDPDAEPRAMLVAPIHPPAERPQWWIYAFEKDRLRVAFDDSGKRPDRSKGFAEVDAEHPITVLEMIRDDRPTPAAGPQAEAEPEPSPPVAEPAGPATKAVARGGDVATDREALQGTWSVIKVIIGGQEVDRAGMLLAPMSFRGEEVEFGPFGMPPVKNRYRFRVDPEGDPRALRVVPIDRPDARPRWWLYSLKGDKLRTAAWLSLDDSRRPKGFDDDPDHSLVVLELVRDARVAREESSAVPEPSPRASVAVPASDGPRPDRPGGLPPREPSADRDVVEPVAPTAAIEEPSPAPPPAIPAPIRDRPAPPLAPSAGPATPPPAAPPPVAPGPPPPAAPPADDLRRLQGTWSIIAEEEDGLEIESDANATVLVAGNAIVLVRGAKARGQSTPIEAETFTLDPSRAIKTIDLTPADGNPGRAARHGIYRVDGPSLLLCVAPDGKPRPSEFDTKRDSGQRLYVLRRKKAPQPQRGLQ